MSAFASPRDAIERYALEAFREGRTVVLVCRSFNNAVDLQLALTAAINSTREAREPDTRGEASTPDY